MTTTTLPRHPNTHPANTSPLTCLYCRRVVVGRAVRGCCSGRCAYLEHDERDDHDDPYDPED